MKHFIVLLLLSISLGLSAQMQLTLVQDYCYDNTQEIKWGYVMKPLKDGNGYVIVGYSHLAITGGIPHHGTPNGGGSWNADAYIAILDNDFNIVKHNIFGGSTANDDDDGFYNVYEQADGSFVCFGSCESPDGDVNCTGIQGLWLFKVDSNLNKIWSEPYSCPTGGNYTLNSIQTRDGGFIMLGASGAPCGDQLIDYDGSNIIADWLVVRTDSAGNKLWANVYGSTGDDFFGNITEDKAGNIYLVVTAAELDYDLISDNAGWRATPGNDGDIFILKMDAQGNKIWTKSMGGTGFDGVLTDVLYDSINNEFLMVGSTLSTDYLLAGVPQAITNNWGNGLFIRMDTAGNVLQKKVIAGDRNDNISSIDFGPTPGTYFLNVYTQSSDSMGTDMYGYIQTGTQNNVDQFMCLIDQTGNMLMKYGLRNIYGNNGGVAFYDENRGEVINNGFFGSDVVLSCNPNPAPQIGDRKPGLQRFRFDPLMVKDYSLNRLGVSIYPNPASDKVLINVRDQNLDYQVSLYDLAGKLLLTQLKVEIKNGLDVSAYAPGTYIYEIKTNLKVESGKIVILK